MTSMVAGRMAEAAARLIDSLDQAQRGIACRRFPDEDERRLWYYTPTDHGGVPLAAMGALQQRNVHRLVATGLSTPGYNTVALIIGLDNILDRLEGWSVDFGRARGRDPQLYYVTIFGEPGGAAPWGWRFGGHHVSLHYTIVGGEVAAATPNFLGADPADSPLLGPHLHRPLAAAEDLGRELFRALGEQQRARALVAPVAPPIWSAATARSSRWATGRRRSPTSGAAASRAACSRSSRACRRSSTRRSASSRRTSTPVSFTAEPKGVPVARAR